MADQDETAVADETVDQETTKTPTSESSTDGSSTAEGEGTTTDKPVTQDESAGHLRRKLIKEKRRADAAEARLKAQESAGTSAAQSTSGNPYATDQDLTTLVETKVKEGVAQVEERLAEQRKRDALEKKADAEEKALKAKFPELYKKYEKKIEEIYAQNPESVNFPKWVFDQVVPEAEQDAAIAARAVSSRQKAEDRIAGRPRPPSAAEPVGTSREGSTISKDEFLNWSDQMAKDEFGL